MIELKPQSLEMLKKYVSVVVLPIFYLVFFQTNISLAGPEDSPETELLSFDKTTIIGHLNFPPLIYANKSGESIGPLADLIRLILDTSKIYPEYKLVTLPTKRIIPYLIEGKIPFSPLIRGIPSLRDKVLYSDSKISTLQINVYYTGESTPIQDLDDLKEKRVIGLRGYSYGSKIKTFLDDPANKVIYFLCNTHQSGFKMLQLGRGDYFIDFQFPSDIVLKNLKIDNLHSAPLETIDVYFNISRNAPDCLNLKERLDNAFHELIKQGKIDQMMHKNNKVKQ